MRKNLISMILAVVLAAGTISPASVCAAEISGQETISEDNEAAQEEAVEEQAQIEAEEPEADNTEEISDDNDTPEPAEDKESKADNTEEITGDNDTPELAEDIAEESVAEETKPEEPFMDEIVIEEEAEEVVAAGDKGGPSEDELFAEFVERSFEGQPLSAASAKKRSAVSALQGNDRMVYNHLAGLLPQIAAGERASTEFEITPAILGLENNSWTAEELGIDAVVIKDENGKAYISAEAKERLDINFDKIIDVLLAEHPYELYWYNKTSGGRTTKTTFGLTAYYDRTRKIYYLSTKSNMYLRFAVAEEYAAGEYLVDTSIGQSVQSAVNNANEIVAEYSGASDEEKLRGYKDDICDLVSYNYAASGNTSYGNPWQMIWVFDGDPDTNVVCEGYSKAFKYLCDHTEFEGSIECILVGGYLARTGKEPHMWNVLKMEDGNNYLVDVTNCDARTAGYPDKLFLAGTTETKTDSDDNTGYYFGTVRLTYYYDSDTLGIFDEADLELFPHNYGEHVWSTESIIDVEPTCTEDGFKSFHCEICDEINQGEIEVLPAIGHNYSDWEVTKKETCTVDGSEEKVCANCADVVTRVIPAIGHNYSDWNVTKEETCTEDGSKEKVCANCADVITEAIPAIGHDYSDWVVTRKATGLMVGIREKTCANCADVITEEIPVLGGTWIKNSTGWWYRWTDYAYPVSMFLNISGKTYYFNASGYMVTGWQKIDGKWYYFDTSGAMQTGWQKIDGKWYYMNSDGAMQTGWQQIDGKKYYMSAGGAMQTGWQQIDGKRYYLSAGGAMQTGWQKIDSKWYYMNSDGVMQTGWQKINGKWYYFDTNGAMQTGWQKIGGKWYYMGGGGAMVVGWLDLGGKKYYMSESGAMVTGRHMIDGKWYYFDESGAMR